MRVVVLWNQVQEVGFDGQALGDWDVHIRTQQAHLVFGPTTRESHLATTDIERSAIEERKHIVRLIVLADC